MTRKLLDDWLRAEDHGGDEMAEEALFELFAALPSPEPSSTFADAVLWRAASASGRRVLDLQGSLRRLTMAALLLTALFGAWWAPLATRLVASFEPAAAVAVVIAGFTGLVHLLVDLGGLVQAAAGLGRALWLAATSPLALGIFAAAGLFVFIVSRQLVALIRSQRSPSHVPI